jgi:catechol 2,3-dioxygenase-like lactoylglutathione lyase family enzyme
MIEVSGIAHVILTVSQWDKARDFYARLCSFLGMTKVYDGNNFLYHVGGGTALGIQRCGEEFAGERFQQNRVGLHHLCFRARSREDVDAAAGFLRDMGAFIDRGPIEGDWAPGYYSSSSRIRTAFGSRSTTFRARACWWATSHLPSAMTPTGTRTPKIQHLRQR